MLRPRPARWFEILTARDDATLVLEALARTGAVELDARPGAGLPADPDAVLPLLTQFAEFETRYAAYWPPASACRPSPFPDAPAHALQLALQTVQAWAQDAEPHIRALQRAEAETAELQLWARVLDARAGSPLPAHELAAAGPLVQARLFVLPPGADAAAALAATAGDQHTLASVLVIDHAPHLLVAGVPAALQALAQRVSTLKGSSHELPAWLRDPALDPAVHVPQRLLALARLISSERAALQALEVQHTLPRALGDVHRLQWLLDNVHALEAGALLCWVTGWCSDTGGQTLARALQASGARALLRHAAAPEALHAPLLLQNPPWARPFELFSRALGMPASNEADPSALLALAVPLMFGYMFGDVGQGLVLAAGAWWLRRRFAVARLLMVGGLSAIAFGFVFGSCFGLHGLPFMPPALWLHPLDDPLAVLVAPLIGGAVLLTLGLGLDAMAAFWRGEAARWLRTDLWLIVTYLGLLAAFVDPAGGWVAAFGALAWCVGHAVQAGRVTAAFSALGEGLEKTLQILINTLSFARVGAFALAHAGLSSALVALMDATDSAVAKVLVLVLGNAIVIVLEAMVVSIQTTRLVLFEFFTRFMQGSGRVFRPLPAPPYATP
ncbi:MAG: hypothetical protein Q7U73_07260 [Rubrivivax sp.]|nr:hypothetical protein [Rubrivivax sp.]